MLLTRASDQIRHQCFGMQDFCAVGSEYILGEGKRALSGRPLSPAVVKVGGPAKSSVALTAWMENKSSDLSAW